MNLNFINAKFGIESEFTTSYKTVITECCVSVLLNLVLLDNYVVAKSFDFR